MLPSDPAAVPDTASPKPPRCAMCRGRMVLAGTQLAADGSGTITFKCPKCAFTKTKIAGDPLNGGRHRAPKRMKAARQT
jgi:phage FluMu protein Com